MSFAIRVLVTPILAFAFCAHPAATGQAKSTVTIDQRVQAAIQGFPGSVSLYAKNRQRDLQGVGRDMKDTVIASKSGALDHLRSEAAIVYSPHGPVAMAITVNNIPVVDYGVDNPGNLLISNLSQILVEELASAK